MFCDWKGVWLPPSLVLIRACTISPEIYLGRAMDVLAEMGRRQIKSTRNGQARRSLGFLARLYSKARSQSLSYRASQ